MSLLLAKEPSTGLTHEDILNDYRLVCTSREISLMARREVFMGKAKFAILGDGKELPQVAMARFFKPGDFRSGYYRDQTFMFALGYYTYQNYFAQLYANTNIDQEPSSGGRMMTCHFGTRLLDDKGHFKELSKMRSTSSDTSPTGSQMPRLLGLANASKLYRQNTDLRPYTKFSHKGNEVAFGTIGNASCAEGEFFETVNAAAVMQVPMLLSVWDDGYGISVANDLQIAKGDISEVLKGFDATKKDETGIKIFRVKGHDYPALIETYRQATELCRTAHRPVLIHVMDLTQPMGHSTSGSHERYKSAERLEFEKEADCNKKFKEWIIENKVADEETLNLIEKEAKKTAKDARDSAYENYLNSLLADGKQALELLMEAEDESKNIVGLQKIRKELESKKQPTRKDAFVAVRHALVLLRNEKIPAKEKLILWNKRVLAENQFRYNSYLHSQSDIAALKIPEVKPVYKETSPNIDGREILQACFNAALERDPLVVAFGEDVGKIGDVNQGFAGLQDKYGELRVFDTGIRETTIVGQAIGMAMRGLRPIAEIQYLDYMLYALQTLSDDLATMQYRTRGGQKAPAIIRTRGHRLEGMWHAGSPMGMLVNSLRGMYICVPRNMTQAAGMYNTLLRSDDPALVIEPLNGYRLKERLPENIDTFTVPLGKPEVLRDGLDVTIVTYGTMCRIVMDAADQLQRIGISCEVIDVQTLLPFDIDGLVAKSVQKTSRVIFADEDVPGGASAFMMQQVLEQQKAYFWLDSQPRTISAKEHRTPFASDGDYFSKPTTDGVFDQVYDLMQEVYPDRFPDLYT